MGHYNLAAAFIRKLVVLFPLNYVAVTNLRVLQLIISKPYFEIRAAWSK